MSAKTESAEETLAWMKGTDLVEVSFKKGKEGFELGLAGAPAPSVPVRLAAARSLPVASPAVGFYHAAAPGQVSKLKAGAAVSEGAPLGYLEAGPKRWDIKSPAAGTLAQVLVDEGAAVQYGQPLFVIQSGS